jgi:gamma-glutamyltranspeptidase / glutathione hydrolase
MRALRAVAAAGAVLVAGAAVVLAGPAEEIRGSATYRPEILGRVGVVAAGRHLAAEAGMRMLARGGNAVDAGVAATFAAAVSEISHFGLGGEVPIALYLADRREVVIINGQGSAPLAASAALFRGLGEIPPSGPLSGTVPAVVDALAIALAEFGTLSLAEVLEPAITLSDGFPWYDYLTRTLTPELDRVRAMPSGARVYLQGPGGTIPAVGSVFRQPELANTLRALATEERAQRALGRKAAIYAARDRFYRGEIGQRIARAVQDAGGILTAQDLAAYRGRVEAPTRLAFRTRHGTFDVFKTGFWGQGPVLLQTLALLQGFDLEGMGHNSAAYLHTVAEALKLAMADRDEYYGDPDFSKVPAAGLLAESYAVERRKLVDPASASFRIRPGDPWSFEGPRAGTPSTSRTAPGLRRVPDGADASGARATDQPRESPDTTTVNVADAKGNLFSASPSSAWFFGGVFIAGDTGVPLGNRMQAFVLVPDDHPNIVRGGKRPRTTLTPTIVLRDGKPYLALSSPGGDSQEQQALQVFLNMAVFGMRAQAAVEAPRVNSLHLHKSFGAHGFGDKDGRAGVLEVENRIAPDVIAALRQLGHRVEVRGPFMLETGTAVAGVDSEQGIVFGAADVRRQRFATGW